MAFTYGFSAKIMSLIAFFILLFSLYRNVLSIYRTTTDPFFSGITLGYLAGFVGMLVHAIGTNTFIIVRIMEPFWFLTAIVIMVPLLQQSSEIPLSSVADGDG